MPRTARVDAPGLFHHVMFRGVAREPIFHDDEDRAELLGRFDRVFPDAGVRCTSWALMPNHGHLKLGTGPVRLGVVMHRALGGYAAWFNAKYRRVGHLFQNRFLSKPVLRTGHFRHLDGYVAGQALTAGIVGDLRELADHPWSGYGALMGVAERRAFHDVELALAHAGGTRAAARRHITSTVVRVAAEGPHDGWRSGLDLVLLEPRSGAGDADAAPRPDAAEHSMPDAEPWPLLDAMIAAGCRAARLPRERLGAGTKIRAASTVRAVLAHLAVDRMGVRGVAVARALGLTPQAVSLAVRRGREQIAERDGLATEVAREALTIARAAANEILILDVRPRESAA